MFINLFFAKIIINFFTYLFPICPAGFFPRKNWLKIKRNRDPGNFHFFLLQKNQNLYLSCLNLINFSRNYLFINEKKTSEIFPLPFGSLFVAIQILDNSLKGSIYLLPIQHLEHLK
jgi:hypothetical protein